MKTLIIYLQAFVFSLLVLVNFAIGQSNTGSLKNKSGQNGFETGESVHLVLGYSKHGSGDMEGVVFGAGYLKRHTKKFSLGMLLQGTINSDRHSIIVDNQTTGQITDASIRFTTAGVQAGPAGKFHLIPSSRHDLFFGLNVFGRYQSASNGSDGYSVYFPHNTGVPTVLIGYQNSTPQHTFSFGGLAQFGYSYMFIDRIHVGIVMGFQTDTNGDALPQAGITIGKNFSWKEKK